MSLPKWIVILLSLIIFSCTKKVGLNPVIPETVKPVSDSFACFTASKRYIGIGDSVLFTNCSQNYERLHWDFGDGFESALNSPNHVFKTKGLYKVSLTSITGTLTHKTTKTVASGMKAFITVTYNFSEWDTAFLREQINRGFFLEVQLLSGADILSPVSEKVQYNVQTKNYLNIHDITATFQVPKESTNYTLRTALVDYYVYVGSNGWDYYLTTDYGKFNTSNFSMFDEIAQPQGSSKTAICKVSYSLSPVSFY